MKVVGLTGGIATGKSTVSKQLIERKVPIVDADLIAREVVKPGQPALKQIQKTFGSEVIQPTDGSLNREKLGSIVFKDEQARKKLNRITHPYIRLEMLRQLLWTFMKGNRLLVMDTPLLLESGINKWVHIVVLVYWYVSVEVFVSSPFHWMLVSSEPTPWVKFMVCIIDVITPCYQSIMHLTQHTQNITNSPEDVQKERLMRRDNSTSEAAQQRISSQMSIEEKRKRADIIIDNSGRLEDTSEQVNQVFTRITPSWISTALAWLVFISTCCHCLDIFNCFQALTPMRSSLALPVVSSSFMFSFFHVLLCSG